MTMVMPMALTMTLALTMAMTMTMPMALTILTAMTMAPQRYIGSVSLSAGRDTGADGSADMVRVRLDLAYDGARFRGWAVQPDLRTVCGELQDALARIVRQDVRVTAAGRTDAGVHARGQVAHLDLPRQVWESLPRRSDLTAAQALARRLAGVLPADIVPLTVRQAPPGFDARFSALWRRYCYRIADRPSYRDPLTRGFVLWHRHPLDEAAMNEACSLLLGEHDYTSYCRPKPGASNVRRLLVFSWTRGPGGELAAEVRADAFCHSMVRALVGAAIAVGEHKRPTDWPLQVLVARRRDSAVRVMPAHGLCLEEVGYPPDDELAARARLTRAHRGPAADDPA